MNYQFEFWHPFCRRPAYVTILIDQTQTSKPLDYAATFIKTLRSIFVGRMELQSVSY